MPNINETIQEGLVLIGNEPRFRNWANEWLPGISNPPVLPDDDFRQHNSEEPLEVWAFRARDIDQAINYLGSAELWKRLGRQYPDIGSFMYAEATPYHWILVAIISLEISKTTR